jgi:uncharacterized protein GlcG (DUF336 family)
MGFFDFFVQNFKLDTTNMIDDTVSGGSTPLKLWPDEGVSAMISLEKAKKALEASEAKARELGITVSTWVLDDYGVPVALSRMDGALHISPRFSFMKANTSQALGLPSGDVAGYAGEGKPYQGVNTMFSGEMSVIAGGFPVKMDGKVVGSVGVGGSMDVNQDVECAKAAVAVLED